MQHVTPQPWQDPIALAHSIAQQQPYMVFLYSGQNVGYTGNKSLLAFNISKHIKASDFDKFSKGISNNKPVFGNAWFGYLGYGLKDCLEQLTLDEKGEFTLPHLWMMQCDIIVEWNHETHEMKVFSTTGNIILPTETPTHAIPNVTELHSNMSKKTYLQHVNTVHEAILRGDLYEANLTRKFNGTLSQAAEPFAVFKKLAEVSPAAYSSFIKLDDTAIISSSPEQFISITPNGNVQTRPIKGSAPRFEDAAQDQASLSTLQNSEKDKAENLMIVDLMRNDLSHHCKLGSITVDDLFSTASYPTVHHMYSTISGQKYDESSTLDVIKTAFPPGSMTGAPKIMAMNLCSTLERQARGVYAGAIGWFGGDGSADLSVVIRTIILQGNKFEFQVGGAIVADSTPEAEWHETITKARGIMRTLGITAAQIEAI